MIPAVSYDKCHAVTTLPFKTKLDCEVKAPFLLNENGDPQFFGGVFAKTSLTKNIFEEGEKFDSRT